MSRQKEAYFVALMLLVTLTTLGGSVSGYPTSTLSHSSLNYDDFINSSVIGDFYQDDSRTDDYMIETFDSCSGDACSSYDFIDGVTDTAQGGEQVGSSFTSIPGEFFGNSALYINATDGEAYSGSDYASIVLSNSTLDDAVFTVEFDFMLEKDDEAALIYVQMYNSGCIVFNHTANGANDTIHTELTSPHVGVTLGFELAEGEWHHMIVSVVNDLSNGLQITAFVSNTTVSFSDSRDNTLTTLTNAKIILGGITGGNVGTDMVIDNIAYYNGSFNTSQIVKALTGTYITNVLQGLLPLVITMAVIGMMIAVIRKVKA